jgi:hypothetical protein
MQTCGLRSRRSAAPHAALAVTLLLGVAFMPGHSRAEDTDAHALAEKFAGEAKPLAPASDEAAMQRRREAAAKQEAAQQAAAEAKRESAEAKRRADAARRAAQQARIDEQDMLARARAEAAERAAEERMLQAEIDRRDAERAAVAAEIETKELEARITPAEREAAEERLIEAAKAADNARKAMEEARAEESRRLAEKLKLAQERRAAQEAAKASEQAASSQAAIPPPATPEPWGSRSAPSPIDAKSVPPEQTGLPPPQANAAPAPALPPGVAPAAPRSQAGKPIIAAPPVSPPASTQTQPETRVTVLIVMNPGDRGIRRTNKTADPVLCLGPDCYVSTGPAADAKHVTRWQALGTFNTLGRRAGACNNSLGCVFRNVELGAVKAMLQPIDLRVMHHDRRETREVRADPTCEAIGLRLSCAAGIKASGYRLWVVPESVARKAGAAALDAAVKAGLPDSSSRV